MPDVAAKEKKVESGTESDSDDNDSIPELEENEEVQSGDASALQGPGLQEELVSKAKQSRGEKKARKIMAKLGLKQITGVTRY